MDAHAKVRAVVDKHLIPELNVRHTLSTPVFVIGHARSGTTIIGNMIRKYLKVNFGPESQFFFRLQRDLPSYGALREDANFRRLVQDIARERCFQLNQFGFSIDVQAVVVGAQRTYAGAIEAIFGQYATHNGMTRWGDKTPLYIEHLFDLDEMFPGAQYIHVVRDGRDVALSNFDVFFGAKNTVVAALDWKNAVSKSADFFATIDERYMQVRYEDFLQDPVEELSRIMQFLQIADDLGEVHKQFTEGVVDELLPGNANKWSRKFNDGQKLRFEQIAHQQLTDLGYETVHDTVQPMPEWHIALWRLAHVARKYTLLRPWLDNFYQVRLRLASLLKSRRG